MVLFFAMNRLTHYRSSREFKIPLDNKIPFISSTIFVYFSAYLLFVSPYFFIIDLEHFRKVLNAYTGIMLGCTTVWLLCPSKVLRQKRLVNENVSHLSLNLFQQILKPYNSFPSMHSAYPICASIATYRFHSPTLGVIFLVWGLLIIIATLTAKQHVLLDVLAGSIWGFAVSLIAFW